MDGACFAASLSVRMGFFQYGESSWVKVGIRIWQFDVHGCMEMTMIKAHINVQKCDFGGSFAPVKRTG